MQSKDIYIAVYWPETQKLLEDPEFLNNAVLINDAELYDEYGSSSYMVRAKWLMKKSNSYKERILGCFQEEIGSAMIDQMAEEETTHDIQKEQNYL